MPFMDTLLELTSVRTREGSGCSLSFRKRGQLKVTLNRISWGQWLHQQEASFKQLQVRNFSGKDFHFLLPQGAMKPCPMQTPRVLALFPH